MRKTILTILTLAVVAFFAAAGTACRIVIQPTPPSLPTATPALPTATGQPTEPPAPANTPTQKPTPIPPPVQTMQLTSGEAVVELSGIDKLPLSPTSDNFAVGVLTWETEGLDRTRPVLELSIRGTSPAPCMVRPCREKAGLIVRYSANLKYDDTLDWSTPQAEEESQKVALGQGSNYHNRLALGSSNLDVLVEWGANSIKVSTPVDSVFFSLLEHQLYAPKSMGFGRFIEGVPWPRKNGRSWLWNTFDATAHGAKAEVTGWQSVGEQFPLIEYK